MSRPHRFWEVFRSDLPLCFGCHQVTLVSTIFALSSIMDVVPILSRNCSSTFRLNFTVFGLYHCVDSDLAWVNVFIQRYGFKGKQKAEAALTKSHIKHPFLN